ncbi:DUF669 domain-containing protein [Leuconostoc mesenteroides]|uniref:DUF669 domain-containing protein n=1 Tax=Leuconostoc mesenteroides TaxID=1245 RepID=UPI001CC152CA|nr:DUF669 domain-containing protein [Leuconostoc mesenteroides]MBZ1529787.1 DUF669 domain-containing protein [Leuconostoc mesenteroides]
MALFTVDSNNTFGKSVQEAGTYNVKVLGSSQYTSAKSSGNEMLVLDYEVLDGNYAGGRIMYDNFVWNPDNIELSEKRFNTLLVSANVPDGTAINGVQDILRGIIGKTLNINVEWKQSDYNQKWNLNVKGYDKVDKEGSKPNGAQRPIDGQSQSTSHSNNNDQFKSADPFASKGNSPLDISDDDLPF